MKKGFLVWVSISLAVGTWLGTDNSTASALSCAEPRKITEELKVSDMVFRGTLTTSHKNDDISKGKYTFQVSEWWKGDQASASITLYSNGWESFEQGKEYIVFADISNKKLKPRLCGNTGLSSSVNVDSLGEGINPQVGDKSGTSEKPGQSAGSPRFGGFLGGLMDLIRFLQGKY